MKRLLQLLFGPRANKTTAGELAKKFGLELRGNPKTVVNGVAPIADAKPGQLAFYSTERNHVVFKILPIEVLHNTKASVILLQPEHVDDAPKGATLLITDTPRGNIVKILGEIYREKPRRGIHYFARVERGVFFRKKRSVYIGQFATVERGAVLEPNVKIYPGAFIGRNVVLGSGTVVYSGAHIENATIGSDCVINANAVIGKDGFGFTRQNGHNVFIPHAGRVVLGNNVWIGANTCIDRGMMADTMVGDDTKIDNLCQLGHNVVIGKEGFIASGCGLAGGVVIGDYVMMGGQTGVANGVHIGNYAQIGAKSGVNNNIGDKGVWMGYPAVPLREFLRNNPMVHKRNIPNNDNK